MSWKSSGSRSWTRVSKWPGVGRTQRWPFSKSDATPDYDEGDITTYITNPVWRTNPTGPTTRLEHDPCGYWNSGIWWTSTPYPLWFDDQIEMVECDIVGGIFKIGLQNIYMEPESIDMTEMDLIEGFFRSILLTYKFQEAIDMTEMDIISGVFRLAILGYEIPVEEIECTEMDLISGTFRDAVIEYQNWPEESIDMTEMDIIGGTYDQS